MPRNAGRILIKGPLVILISGGRSIPGFRSFGTSSRDSHRTSRRHPSVRRRGNPRAPISAPSGPTATGKREEFTSPLTEGATRNLNIGLRSVSKSNPRNQVMGSSVLTTTPPTSLRTTSSTCTSVPLDGVQGIVTRQLTRSGRAVPRCCIAVSIGVSGLLRIQRGLGRQDANGFGVSIGSFLVGTTTQTVISIPRIGDT